MKKIFAFDTNIVIGKKRVFFKLSKNQPVFFSYISKLSATLKSPSFHSSTEYDLVIPYFVMKEIENQLELGLEEYIISVSEMNQKLLKSNGQKILRKKIAEELKQLKTQSKILKKPSVAKIAKWTEEYFEMCGKRGITKSDGKDYIIGKEIEDNKIEFIVTDNTKDFVNSFPNLTPLVLSVVMDEINEQLVDNEAAEEISKYIEEQYSLIRYDVMDGAESEMVDWGIYSFTKTKDGYSTEISIEYKNEYEIDKEAYLKYEEDFPNKTNVIITLEKSKNEDLEFIDEEEING